MSAAVSAPGPSQDVRPVRRALVSVYDKTGLDGLVRGLHEAGVALVSTGGPAALIESLGLPVTKVEDLTGFPSASRAGSRRCTPGARRHPRRHPQARPRGPAGRPRRRGLRARGRQPLPVRGHRRLGGVPRRVRRADRHRRPVDGARGRQEPPERRRGHRPVLLRRRAGRRARRRFHPGAAQAPGGAGLRAHRHLRRARGVLDGQRLHRTAPTAPASRPGSARPGSGRRCCATARTRTSTRPCTPTASSRGRRWPRQPSCTARRCRTTTTSTRMPPCAPRTTTATSPPWPSSSTPTPAGSPWAPTSPTPTARPTSATRCRRSAASSPPSAQVAAEMARTVADIFTEVVVAPEFDADALEVLSAKKNIRLLECAAPVRSRCRGADHRRRPPHAAARRRGCRGDRRRRRRHRW